MTYTPERWIIPTYELTDEERKTFSAAVLAADPESLDYQERPLMDGQSITGIEASLPPTRKTLEFLSMLDDEIQRKLV